VRQRHPPSSETNNKTTKIITYEQAIYLQSLLMENLAEKHVQKKTTLKKNNNKNNKKITDAKTALILQYCASIELSARKIRQIVNYNTCILKYDLQQEKFLECCFKLFCVVCIRIYSIYVCVYATDIFWDHRTQWPEHPGDGPPYKQYADAYLIGYYAISLGYHMQRALTQFSNPSRKDFWVLFIHHWSTIVCITFSYFAAFMRSGALVLFLHENADIYLEAAKICKYMGYTKAANSLIGIFAMSWVVFRLMLFPYKVLYEVYRNGYLTLMWDGHPMLLAWICVALLYVLEALHIWWFRLLVNVIWKMLNGKDAVDIRSDTEDEEDHDDEDNRDPNNDTHIN
jgi:hypothetical protein